MSRSTSQWQRYELPDAYWFQEGPGVRQWQFRRQGIKLLNVANITTSGTIDLDKTDRYLSIEEVENKYKHFLVDEGDLVIASSGISFDSDGFLRTRGAFVRKEHLPLCMNTSTIRFKSKENISDLRFLKYWLDSSEFRTQISRFVTGSAQQNFGPSHLKELTITFPPLPEQQRIAALLDRADRLRRMRRYAEELSASFLQSVFVQMFGDPVKNPMGWDVVALEEVTESLDSRRIPIEASVRAIRRGLYPYYGASGIIDYIDDYIFDEQTLCANMV
jgi:type I restriction enzyme S subunit